MLLCSLLLLFLCESAVKPWITTRPSGHSYSQETSKTADRTTEAAEDKLSDLQVVATPDSTLSLGERVDLHCSGDAVPDSVTWSWQRLENQAWREVGSGRNLTLTQSEQSGLYRCRAQGQSSQETESPHHTVYIISMRAAVSEHLGRAAISLSLLALIVNVAVLIFWGCQKRLGDTSPNTAAEGIPRPEQSPKGGLPKTDGDRDVYINYTSTKQTYDPTMTGDDVYASVS